MPVITVANSFKPPYKPCYLNNKISLNKEIKNFII